MREDLELRLIKQRLSLEEQHAAIMSRVASLEAGLAEAKNMLVHIDELLLSVARIMGDEPEAGAAPYEPVRRATGNPKKEVIAQEVRDYLKAGGRPMSRRELFQRLCNDGITLRGTNPEVVLSTMLWRAGNMFGIERLNSGGYALKSWRRIRKTHDPATTNAADHK